MRKPLMVLEEVTKWAPYFYKLVGVIMEKQSRRKKKETLQAVQGYEVQ